MTATARPTSLASPKLAPCFPAVCRLPYANRWYKCVATWGLSYLFSELCARVWSPVAPYPRRPICGRPDAPTRSGCVLLSPMSLSLVPCRLSPPRPSVRRVRKKQGWQPPFLPLGPSHHLWACRWDDLTKVPRGAGWIHALDDRKTFWTRFRDVCGAGCKDSKTLFRDTGTV